MNGLFEGMIPGSAPKTKRRQEVTCPKCTGWGEVNTLDPSDGVIWNVECPYCDAEGKVTPERKAAFDPAEHGPVGYDCEASPREARRMVIEAKYPDAFEQINFDGSRGPS